MRFWVGITDGNWFEALRRLDPDEVNFWQPSEKPPRRMEPGWPFLFKLHSPRDFIVGGGFFVRFTVLPCSLAWETFGLKNGAENLQTLIERTSRYRRAPQTPATRIGCNVLTEPFFFDEEDWIPVPEDWPRNIQRGLTYDTDSNVGESLWHSVVGRLPEAREQAAPDTMLAEPQLGSAYLARARLGQGAFRTLVTDLYHRRCAVTGEGSLPALEAAHIKAHSSDGPNIIRNGLLLRADIHRLFDDGYVTIDPDLHFVVSQRLREEFENGRVYYAHHGQRLANIPDDPSDCPSREFIEWHNTEQYLG